MKIFILTLLLTTLNLQAHTDPYNPVHHYPVEVCGELVALKACETRSCGYLYYLSNKFLSGEDSSFEIEVLDGRRESEGQHIIYDIHQDLREGDVVCAAGSFDGSFDKIKAKKVWFRSRNRGGTTVENR